MLGPNVMLGRKRVFVFLARLVMSCHVILASFSRFRGNGRTVVEPRRLEAGQECSRQRQQRQ